MAAGEITESAPEPTLTYTPTADAGRLDGSLHGRRHPERHHRPDPVGHRAGRHGAGPDRHGELTRDRWTLTLQARHLHDHRLRVRRATRETSRSPCGRSCPRRRSRPTSTCCCSRPTGPSSETSETTTPSPGGPSEILAFGGLPEMQLAIARRTTGRTPVSQVRYVLIDGGIQVAEYLDPLAPATYGHPVAAGAISVAAVRPVQAVPAGVLHLAGRSAEALLRLLGPALLATPKVRSKPDVAAIDRGNTTFFVADDARDRDEFPNFGGTSASAPHAAAIAALLLDTDRRPGVADPRPDPQPPAELRRSRTTSTPSTRRAQSHGLRISVNGAQGDERDWTPGSLADPRFFTVELQREGAGAQHRVLRSHGQPDGARPQLTSSPSAGIVFDRRKMAGPARSVTEGSRSWSAAPMAACQSSTVRAEFSRPGGFGSPRGQFHNLTVKFGTGLRSGQDAPVRSGPRSSLLGPAGGSRSRATAPTSWAVRCSSRRRRVDARGMRFTAVLANGDRISGALTNRLRKGWSPVDGYGLINARTSDPRRVGHAGSSPAPVTLTWWRWSSKPSG